MKAKEMQRLVNEKLPPLTWNIIGLRFFQVFFKNKMKPTNLTDEDLPRELETLILDFVRAEYKVELLAR